MAIVNRDFDVSQQKDVINHTQNSAVATGATLFVAALPYPCTLAAVSCAATGVSNAMQVGFYANRWVTAGLTSIPLGISNMVLVEYSSSGVVPGLSMLFTGSSAVALLAGDVITLQTSVTNGNALKLAFNFIVKKTQDIVSHDGISS